MVLRCSIVAASSSILLVLLSTPAVVEGTNKCIKVCPNWVKRGFKRSRRNDGSIRRSHHPTTKTKAKRSNRK